MGSSGTLNMMVSTFALSNVVDHINDDVCWSSNSVGNMMNQLMWTAKKAVNTSNAVHKMYCNTAYAAEVSAWSSNQTCSTYVAMQRLHSVVDKQAEQIKQLSSQVQHLLEKN